MSRTFRFFLFLGAVSLTNFFPLFALQIPEHPEGYVSDDAGILSPSALQNIESQLGQFEKETSSQVMVATFPSLEGDSLESFSIRLAEAWKPGQKGKDNGVILLVFKEDRKVRIEVGYGLEGVLTDATSSLIIQNEIVPKFRDGHYEEGIQNAVSAIMSATRGEYSASPVSPKNSDLFFIALAASFIVARFFPEMIVWCLVFVINIVGLIVVIITHQIILGVFAFFFSILLIIWRYIPISGNSSGFGSGGGHSRGDGGGRGRGGGRFGGGGASGSW